MKKHLAFDFGAESGRAIVGCIDSGVLKMEEIYRFPTQSMFVHNSLRWNIYRLYEEIIRGLRIYVSKFGPELDSIGIDTWGVDYGLLADDGTMLEMPYQYRDSRTKGTPEIIEEKLGRKKVYDITGIQFMNINTLNQMVSVERDNPGKFEDASEMLFIGDILNYFLSGEKASEFTVASTSQMLDAFSKEWSDEIFSAFGIPDKFKSRIVFAGDVLGEIDDAIAAEVGLNKGVKIIVPAIHDTASAATAIPAQGGSWAYLSSGTWCMLGLETDEPVINEDSFALNISNSGGALGKNLFLKNVMGLWTIQQCKKAWNKRGHDIDYPEIVDKAITAKHFAGYIDPDDDLFFAPIDNIDAVKEYFRRTGQPDIDFEDIGTVARIVYESLALKYRYVIERLKKATGQEVEVLHIIGGGTKNKLMNQFTSNALGIKAITGPAEATASGNLLLQAYGCGEIASLEELRQCVVNSNTFDIYEPEDSDEWSSAFEEFKRVCGLD